MQAKEAAMPDIEKQRLDVPMSGGPPALMDWRRVLLGWGFLVLIAAVFVGAATKNGGLTKIIGAVGVLMILVSTVSLVATWLRAKTSHAGRHASGSAGSRP
jgi:hypothetical protein